MEDKIETIIIILFGIIVGLGLIAGLIYGGR